MHISALIYISFSKEVTKKPIKRLVSKWGNSTSKVVPGNQLHLQKHVDCSRIKVLHCEQCVTAI